MAKAKPKAPVVSVLNMKGGVGKTTVAAHIFRVLYHRHEISTLLVDLDPQFNLTQCVVSKKKYETIEKTSHTIMSAFEPQPSKSFFEIKTTTHAPPSPSTCALNLRSTSTVRLDLLPGHFDLIKYSLIDDHEQLKAALSYFKRFIAKARDEYGLIVIDCNPSSSFITRCALEVSTHVVSPVRCDKYSVLGVELVDKLLDHLPLEEKPTQLALINGVKRNAAPDTVENALRKHKVFGQNVLVARVPNSSLLRADETYTGFATDRPVPWRDLLRAEIGEITDELTDRLGLN